MRLQTFEVIFDRASAAYAAGETVTGKIALEIDHAKVVRGMHVEVKGEGRVVVTRYGLQDIYPMHTSAETYLDLNFDILGTQTLNSRTEITAGYHEYRFSYQLPKNIPNTFNDMFGRIAYTMKVVITRPRKSKHVHESTFTVISPLDLNDYDEQRVSINEKDCVDLYSCCCCIEGALHLDIKVPTIEYIPGQTIYTTINYENTSRSVEMTWIKAELKQVVRYRTYVLHHRFLVMEYVIKSTKLYAPFPKKGQAVLDLLIPYAPPSYIGESKIIDLKYKLDLTISVSGQSYYIEKSYPIIIGTMNVSQITDPVSLTFPVIKTGKILAKAKGVESIQRDCWCCVVTTSH